MKKKRSWALPWRWRRLLLFGLLFFFFVLFILFILFMLGVVIWLTC